MSVAVAVVAHPARLADAEYLAADLAAHLVIDEHQQGEWPTHERALAWAAEQDVTHALIVQDDAVPVPRLLDHVAAAVDAHPDGPIGLYVGRSCPRPAQVERAVRTADEVGASWLEANTLLWGVATILPVQDLAPLLAWCRRVRLPYDERVGSWYRHRMRPVRYTWPSLVDHADWPSLTGGRARRPTRVAWRAGEPTSWDGPIVPIGARYT